MAIPAAAGERFGVGLRYLHRFQFWKCYSTQQRRDVLSTNLLVTLVRLWRDAWLNVVQPPVEELGQGGLVRLQVRPAAELRNQAGALDLRCALCAGECVPAALAFARLNVSDIKDDSPMAGGSFADVALHCDLSFALWVPFQPDPKSCRSRQCLRHSSGK